MSLMAEIFDDEDFDSFAAAPYLSATSGCCQADVMDDPEGLQFCTYCGRTQFLPGSQPPGCVNCGSTQVTDDGHCEECTAFLGDRLLSAHVIVLPLA
jgi:hypothetical protein